ncbi:MAG: glycosyltransferase [Candidatus Bathyarchaeia archaeon]
MDLALSVITKNSFTKLKNIPINLIDVLDSTKQLPYRTVILVDDSTDQTVEVFKEWCEREGKELVLIRGAGTRAIARQKAIDCFLGNLIEAWLMFVDDDVILNHGWWSWVLENKVLEEPSVGEIWGISWDASPQREKFLSFFGIEFKDYLIRKFNERGGTHDTLYRREAIEGIKIPPELHVYEDAWLHFYVKCRGYNSVVNPIGVRHYHLEASGSTDEEKKKIRTAIEVMSKYGIIEYETYRAYKASQKAVAYLALARPILGFPPMLFASLRAYGLKQGFREALARQYLKIWFRWQMIKAIKKHCQTSIPDICEAIRSYCG